jgi:predicted chitinase
METLVDRAERLGVATATVSEMLDAIEHAYAQLEVSNSAMEAAVSKAQWQARTNHEMNQLIAENERMSYALRFVLNQMNEGAWIGSYTHKVVCDALKTPNAEVTGAPPAGRGESNDD